MNSSMILGNIYVQYLNYIILNYILYVYIITLDY